MSTNSGADADRRAAELALGVELNALLSASRALTERSAAVFHPGVQPAAFHVARWLYAYGPANPSAVADAVAMDRSSTSALIRQLKAAGLVESAPDPADGRAVRVSLTSAGAERVREALDLRGTAFFERTADWSVADLRTLSRLLHELTGPRDGG
ncbi:MarR family winged helix-turn-helix transcriptional regulator [Leifsonia sp. NPDC014704]|uniref:MarR family winged helix-turn-helix transcriptional regulator n=1 Tax=Leifsonia sp. NPDC014704 TaxID=3364123 RepID=UPI0036F4626E